ncbi:alpha/beta hydrolase, partial [Mycobacterium tuberculosis]|nr:alpha/beta hydrolase [Mycobacterium tuberculosis]
FSMGGGIAQLAWRRHPSRVSGLVLCSTGPFFSERDPHRRGRDARIGRVLRPIYESLPRPTSESLDQRPKHTSVWAFKQFLSTPLSHAGDFGEGRG